MSIAFTTADLLEPAFVEFAIPHLINEGLVDTRAMAEFPEDETARAVEYIREFILEFVGKFSDLQMAKDYFIKWVALRPKSVPTDMYIQVSRTYAIGNGETVAFTFGGTFPVFTTNDRRYAASYLLAQTHGAYEYYARHHVNREQATRQTHENALPGEEKTMRFTAVRKGNQNGKDRYNFVGVPYTQFGVAAYDDMLKQSEFGPAILGLKYGEHALSGTMTVWLENGKPKRVISFKID